MITIVESRPPIVPLRAACHALGLNRSTLYARRNRASRSINPENQKKTVITSVRALSSTERQQVLETLNSEPYADQPPAQVYYQLLQEGTYLCSISTMHRLLRTLNQNGDRRPQRAPATQPIPRLMASRPNEVWTWDVSKLSLQTRGVYLSLYVVMDLYSRYIVAWMVSRKENSALAQQLFREATDRYQIERLTVHQDRGAPMIANAYLDLLSELSITASHSRPRVSNDNPMSESQFKTMKYQPDYPRRFHSLEHARLWCEDYVHWYNFSHHHTGIASFTPSQVFTGQHVEVAQQRQDALDLAFLSHPERFVSGPPKVTLPPPTVYINPVLDLDGRPDPAASVNFPTLGRVKSKLT